MEIHRIFRLSRQRHTTTSVNYNLFKMGLTEGAISLYILLLENSGMHRHTEFINELGISENIYLTKFGELENAGLIQVLEIRSALSKAEERKKIDTVVVLNIQAAYEKQLREIT